MKRIGWAALGLSLAAIGCARGPDVAVNALALQRVVIYRNGVGYFERRGKIDADSVTFQVRTERVGDFLATLAVMEQGGSSVHSASFPVDLDKKKLEEADDEDEADEPSEKSDLPIKPPRKKKKKKDADKDALEEVKLTLDGKEHDLTVGYVAETPVWRPSYRLVVHPRGPGGKAGDKPIAGGAELQAWGIVQNTSGEDWKGIRLSLVAGAPLAFQSTLEKAVVPPRPIVTDQGEVISSVPTGETSLADRPPPKTPAPAAPPAPVMVQNGPMGGVALDQLAEKKAELAVGRGGGSSKNRKDEAAKRPAASTRARPAKGDFARDEPDGAPGAPPPPPPAEAPPAQPTSTPRDVRALAAVAMEAGTTRYDLPFAVDVPNHSATMVLLVAKPVPGESIYLFAPDGGVPGSLAHPFRVARFTNDTKGLLEKGPIAVFENGAFLGQGMVDPLPPGATATVPFALERSLAVESARTENEEGARLAKIEGGRIEIERDWVTHTKYSVKNGSDLDARVLIKHQRLSGSRLHEAPRGTEDNTGTMSALVPVGVGRGATGVLDVDERRENRRQIDPLDPLADDAVKAYLADSRADKDVVLLLKPAWEARAKLRTTVDEKLKLDTEKYALEGQINQLDRSLKAIEKNALAAALRKDLTDRLGKAHARLDEVVKRLVVVEMQASEQAIRFRDLLNAIKMVKPLATDKL